MSHVGGDEDGGEDVTEDEDADDGQQSVHAVLQRPGGGEGTLLEDTHLMMVMVIVMKWFVLSVISYQT